MRILKRLLSLRLSGRLDVTLKIALCVNDSDGETLGPQLLFLYM